MPRNLGEPKHFDAEDYEGLEPLVAARRQQVDYHAAYGVANGIKLVSDDLMSRAVEQFTGGRDDDKATRLRELAGDFNALSEIHFDVWRERPDDWKKVLGDAGELE